MDKNTVELMAKRFLVLGAVLIGSFCSNAYAACDAKDDPCAPKKALDAWSQSLAAGFNYTSGNSTTTVVTLLGKANRETTEDVIELNADYSYGEDRAREAVGEDKKNKDDARAGATYKYLLSERAYVGGIGAFLYDDIADIDYRLTLVPNVGYYVLKDADFKLSFDVGPGYTFEKVGGVDNDYFSPRIGDRFEWIISCTAKAYQAANVVFDTSDSSNTVVNSEVGIEAAIATNLSLVLLLRDTFDNVPAEGKLKNDLATITALKVSF